MPAPPEPEPDDRAARAPLLERRPHAILLDGLGTLLELEPPAPLLVTELRERFGIEVGLDDAKAAIVAEIAYYRAHIQDGRDHASLALLRRHSAEIVRNALPELSQVRLHDVVAALMAALRFRPFPEVPGALRALRAHGVGLVVVSNWDISLHDRLAELELDRLVDGILTSAELGVAKPAPGIFRAALTMADVLPQEALHVGDSYEADVLGARAAGIPAALIVRDERAAPAGVIALAGLDELVDLI